MVQELKHYFKCNQDLLCFMAYIVEFETLNLIAILGAEIPFNNNSFIQRTSISVILDLPFFVPSRIPAFLGRLYECLEL